MYEITIKKSFSAAHTIVIDTRREELHGHNFDVEVTLASEELNRDGVVIDFRIVKQLTDEVLKELDHRYLNELESFSDLNPTSENIARYIFNRISDRIGGNTCRVTGVAVWESNSARAVYRGTP